MRTMMAIRFLGASLLFALPLLARPAELARLPQLERVVVVEAPKAIANFTLIDQDAKPRTLASFRGAPLLIFFGFTHCPEVCPAAMAKLKTMYEANAAVKSARVVFISVDGERDTAEVLKTYLAWLPKDFVGLTGNPRAVADIAARFSAVAYKEQAGSQGNYGYFHSSQVYLLDKEGRLRASFDDAKVEYMAAVTQLLVAE